MQVFSSVRSYRITEWVREKNHNESSCPTSLLKQGHPTAHFTGLHPDSSQISPDIQLKPASLKKVPCWSDIGQFVSKAVLISCSIFNGLGKYLWVKRCLPNLEPPPPSWRESLWLLNIKCLNICLLDLLLSSSKLSTWSHNRNIFVCF